MHAYNIEDDVIQKFQWFDSIWVPTYPVEWYLANFRWILSRRDCHSFSRGSRKANMSKRRLTRPNIHRRQLNDWQSSREGGGEISEWARENPHWNQPRSADLFTNCSYSKLQLQQGTQPRAILHPFNSGPIPTQILMMGRIPHHWDRLKTFHSIAFAAHPLPRIPPTIINSWSISMRIINSAKW